MIGGDDLGERRCQRLLERVALSLAFEEAAIAALSDEAAELRSAGHPDAAREVEVFIRRHRVGTLKHRAVMKAHGLEV